MISNCIKLVLVFLFSFSSITYNLVVNGDFSHNIVSFAQFEYFASIDGWICKSVCQLRQCHRSDNLANCSGNYLDLASQNRYQTITQLINVEQKSIFELVIEYFNPRYNDNLNQTLFVYFNKQVVSSISTNQSDYNTSNIKIINMQIIANSGINNLTLTMTGGSITSSGFNIKHVSLTFIKPATSQNSLTNFIDFSLENRFSENFMKIPGGRIIWTNYVMFFTNFDRFQLYIFHNRSYSQNSLIFLKKVNVLQQLQIDLLKDMANNIRDGITESTDKKKQQFSFKKWQNTLVQMQRVQQRFEGFKDGFIENQLDYLVYKILTMCILFGVLKLVFHTLYNYPVSLIFRKYYFYGTLFVLIIDGSIQELTFYLVMEITLLSNYSFANKFTNHFMVIAMYFVMMASFGLFILIFSYCRKYLKNLQQNCKAKLKGIVASTIDRGIVCLLFGMAHRLLIQQPNIQLFVLIAIQAFWIASRLILMQKKAYQSKILLVVWVIQGFLRIGLQISFYFYENSEENRQFINNFHQYYIKVYICVMILQFLINSFELLREIFRTLKSIYKYSFKNKNTISSQQKKEGKSIKNGKQNAQNKNEKNIKKDKQNEKRILNNRIAPKIGNLKNKEKLQDPERKIKIRNLIEKVKQQEFEKEKEKKNQRVRDKNRRGILRFASPQITVSSTFLKKQLSLNHRQKGHDRKEEFSRFKSKQKKVKKSPNFKEDVLFVIRRDNKNEQY